MTGAGFRWRIFPTIKGPVADLADLVDADLVALVDVAPEDPVDADLVAPVAEAPEDPADVGVAPVDVVTIATRVTVSKRT